MNVNERDEISASVAAHAELGPRYDAAVAEGLVERIGDEIDKRIDARLRGQSGQQAQQQTRQSPTYQGPFLPAPDRPAAVPPPAPPAPSRGAGFTGMVLGLGSMGLGVGATSVVVSHHPGGAADVLMVLLIWVMITIINVAHAQRR